MSLEIARENVAEHMDGILQSFKPGAKITVIVRRPGNTEADFLMTNEADLSEASAVISRREAASLPKSPSAGEEA